ncbi:MAG: DNA polymerase III subunit gamma/tau, partial [Deltaproteobacteria bacterium]|nr:DNA polymerase III subunit gamma/tau [Deltaproteobacteria bacterium]
MSYLVLARKWRPRYFDEVAGQEHVTRTLVHAIEQDRVHHAFLFTGARGVGKTTCARLLAKSLNCHRGPTGRPCYACPSCEEISSGASVDVFEIDGASNRGIDEIRELRESVKYAPSRDRFKIYIIDEVHMLTEAAFNALLKTLEEPPGHIKFIFATTEPRKIPVTILSRCQRFDFKRIAPTELTRHLQGILDAEGVTIDAAALALIVREAEGTARDALSLLDQSIAFAGKQITYAAMLEVLGLADRSNLHQLTEALLQREATRVLELVEQVHGFGHDLARFAAELLQHLRDLVVIRTTRSPEALVQLAPAEVEALRRLVAGVDPGHLRRLFFLMLEGVREIARSSFPRLVLEMTLLRMLDLAPPLSLEPLLQRLE